MAETENTDLIDVSDVAAAFDEETDDPREKRLSAPREEAEETIASLKDRFAAAFIDTLCVIFFYGILSFVVRMNVFLFHGAFLIVVLGLALLFEGIFAATPGKWLCGLRVRKLDGSSPGFGAILVRNLLRIIDLPLQCALIGIVIMEKSTWHQRLGDLAARTVVIHRHQQTSSDIPSSLTGASASGRMIAASIDTVVTLAFALGYLLFLHEEAELLNRILLLALPLVLLAYQVTPDVLLGTTLGKWLCGYRLRQDDGTPPTVSSIVIRTLFRLADCSPWGLIALVVSNRKQRLGDAAADTLVVRESRNWKSLIGIALVLITSGVLLSAGLSNRESLLRSQAPDTLVSSFSTWTTEFTRSPSSKRSDRLLVQKFIYGAGTAGNHRLPPIFSPGETIYFTFQVDGYAMREGEAWLEEDLTVRYPDDRIGLKLEKIVEFRSRLEQPGPIELINTMSLPPNAVEGRYAATITIRDKHSGKELKEQRFFYVSKPANPVIP
ncbi:MAG: RDD family protein [Deltaproteobacteria bacterium]|nr:RDD family protein [Deltaproteobacteria bacterium]